MDKPIKPVELSSRAIRDLQKLKAFSIDLFGKEKTQEFIDALFEFMGILENPDNKFDQLGKIDETFAHLKYSYRKLIKDDIKITYRLGKTKIYVVRIFDTRQHPSKNK